MMCKVEDEVDNNNEDVEENPTFGNQVERIIILVQCGAIVAKTKEWALLLFKRIEPDKDGVSHSCIVTIPKTKTKLFHLVICYISCGTSFHMETNIISYTYEVMSNPSLCFCTRHHVSSFVRVVSIVNLQHIFDIL
jgi:hypothetical protein